MSQIPQRRTHPPRHVQQSRQAPDKATGSGCLMAMAILCVVALSIFLIARPGQERNTPELGVGFPTRTPRTDAMIAGPTVEPFPTSTQASMPPTEPPALPTGTTAPTPPAEQPRTLKGSTGQNTPPFTLAGGTYEARWVANLTNSSCFLGIELASTTDERNKKDIVSTILDEAVPTTDSSFLYNVAPGQYYLAVNGSGCPWEVTLTPKKP